MGFSRDFTFNSFIKHRGNKMTDPDEVVRMFKTDLEITLLEAEERGFQKALVALCDYSDESHQWGMWLGFNRNAILNGGES